jgi:hypothetical protein
MEAILALRLFRPRGKEGTIVSFLLLNLLTQSDLYYYQREFF